MKKLTIELLAPYLPYNLKMAVFDYYEEGLDEWEIKELSSLSIDDIEDLSEWWDVERNNYFLNDEFKPVLHPLSDLTKEIEYKGERFVPFEKISMYNGVEYLIEQIQLGLVEVIIYKNLLKWNFDVSNLLENDLAINYNKIYGTEK